MKNKQRKLLEADGIRKIIRRRDNYKCYFCERDIRRGKINSLAKSIHHIIPKSLGGKLNPKNCITICIYCHHKLEKLNHLLIKELKTQTKNEKTNNKI